MLKKIAICFCICGMFYPSLTQTIIYGVGNDRIALNKNSIFSLEIENCNFTPIKTFDVDTGLINQFGITYFREIAINKYGIFYIIGNGGAAFDHLIEYDLTNDTFSVYPLPSFFLSMTADRNGDIVLGGLEYGKFDINSKQYSKTGDYSLGYIPSGDMSFFQDSLVAVSFNDFIYVDTNNTEVAHLLWDTGTMFGTIHGTANVIKNCDQYDFYFNTGGLNDAVYKWNRATNTATQICNTPPQYQVFGLASKAEFAPPICFPLLDLDVDNSASNAFNVYNAGVACVDTFLNLTDLDVNLDVAGEPDSLVIQFESGRIDGQLEGIDITVTTGLNFNVRGDTYILSSTLGGASVSDFSSALLAAKYINSASPKTEGLRLLSVLFYANGYVSDTAYISLNVLNEPFAGVGQEVELCDDIELIDFDTLFLIQSMELGEWIPNTINNGVLDLNSFTGDSILYVVSKSGCQSDTAFFPISINPIPTFDLGPSQSFCNTDSLVLQLPQIPNSAVLWSTGDTTSNITIEQSGAYSAQMTSQFNCIFSDTINLLFLDTTLSIQKITDCIGNSFDYLGVSYDTDTILTNKFLAANGCDSTHVLEIDFFPILEVLDTTVCKGQLITFLGQVFEEEGLFDIEIDTGGCITFGKANIEHYDVEDTFLEISICDGESYLFGGDSLNTSGYYYDTIPSITGCDSIAEIELIVSSPLPNSVIDTTFFENETNQLVLPNSDAVSWEWIPSNGLSCIDCPSPFFLGVSNTSYQVFINDSFGCADTLQLNIEYVFEEDSMGIYFPNIFTPNGNLNNSVFAPLVPENSELGVLLFEIYDRWGNLVFEKKDLNILEKKIAWDGLYQGKKCLAGVYVYKMILSDNSVFTGTVQLVW